MRGVTIGLVVFCLGVSARSADGQVTIKKRIDSKEGFFHLQELQLFLTSANDTVKVMVALPADRRPEGYGDIEMNQGDEILMVNAKRVKTVEAFEEIYNRTEIGGEIKMGIRRAGAFHIESFRKLDPAELQRGPKISVQIGEADAGPGAVITRMITADGEELNGRPWFGTGLLLSEVEGGLKVSGKLQGMTSALGDADIREGDEIVALAGVQVTGFEQFFEAYEKVKVGDPVEVRFRRKGKAMTATFTKPKSTGRMMIMEQN